MEKEAKTMKLHELEPDHRLRNIPIKSIEGLRIHCRNTTYKAKPATWKISKETFNRLGESWRTNYDFIVEESK
jgi:broad specificity phosphatase PhoE